MPSTPLIIAGHCYTHGTETAIEDVIVTVKNTNPARFEEHNGAESAFSELTTNSDGEFQVNLANFTNGYADGDEIEVSLNYGGKRDLITVTISGTTPISSLVLTPLDEEVYSFERTLEAIGDKVTIFRESRTLDTDYDSVDTETHYAHPIDDDTYTSIQVKEDEVSVEDEGTVSHGVAKGFFKHRYNISKDDVIKLDNNYWRVQDRPILQRFKNEPHHYEANLVRIYTVEISADGGSLVTTIQEIEISKTYAGTGADLSGSDGTKSRVLTITTTATPFREEVYVDGARISSSDYSVDYNSTSLVITFTEIDIWDSQQIVVDYRVY